MRCSPAYTVHRMLFPTRCSRAIEVNDAVIACIFIATDSRIFIRSIFICSSVAILLYRAYAVVGVAHSHLCVGFTNNIQAFTGYSVYLFSAASQLRAMCFARTLRENNHRLPVAESPANSHANRGQTAEN